MATIIDGKKIAEQIKDKIKDTMSYRRLLCNKIRTLAVIQVGNDQASSTYVRNKIKACEYVGINSVSYKLNENISQEELINVINKLNDDTNISGILIQLPLPEHIDEYAIINSISPDKDVDCFHPENVGALTIGNIDKYLFLPCTAAGIVELLKRSNIEIKGKHCVIIGRSNIVGKPLASLMLRENATVTIAHSKSESLQAICKSADILVVAIGKERYITSQYVRPGAVVIDVGINVNPKDGKLYGDVDFNSVEPIARAITPVP